MSSKNMNNSHKNWDLVLQSVFVIGLMFFALLFYFTRIVPGRADDGKQLINVPKDYTYFEFIQYEDQLKSKIKSLQVDYSNSVQNYQSALLKLQQSGLDELELREKTNSLKAIYNQEFFDKKIELLDIAQKQLEDLENLKCQKFCTYEDLSSSQQ